MTSRGVLLYGPPAAGKDTITGELVKLDPSYRLYRRLKVGPGRENTYRPTTVDELDSLDVAGQLVWRNERYGAVYAIDRTSLEADARDGVPVVHLGQLEAVDAVRLALPAVRWLTVYVHCPRAVAAERIAARGTGDDAARLTAWDQTPALDRADLDLDTERTSAAAAARRIRHAVSALRD